MFFKSLKEHYTSLLPGLKALFYLSIFLSALCYLLSAALRAYGIWNGCLLSLLPAVEGLYTIAPAMTASGICAVVICDLISKEKGIGKRK